MVPFRNGRGMVSAVRDGRVVQLAATLREDHAGLPCRSAIGSASRTSTRDASASTVSVIDHDTSAQKP